MRILGLASETWQTKLMFRLLSKLGQMPNVEFTSLGVMDFFQMVHRVPTLNEFDIPKNMEIRTQDDMYKSWQALNEDPNELKRIDFSLWEAINCRERTLSEIEKGNALTNQWEREQYWLPFTKYWEKRVLSDTILWCEKYLDEFKPDIVISLERYELAQSIMYELCKTRNIKFLTFITSRIGNRWIARTDFGYGASDETIDEIERVSLNSKAIYEAQELAVALRNQLSGVYTSTAYKETLKSKDMRRRTLFYLKSDLRKLAGDIYSRHVLGPKKMTIRVVRFGENQKNFTFLKLKKLFKKYLHACGFGLWGSKRLPDKPYFLWALHARPEASVLVLGDGRDEMLELKRILELLPSNHLLAVKENPEMFGMRMKKFYSNLKKEKRIFLVDPYADTHEFVKASSGVVGISGTVLLEAALFGKPVCALGHPEFESCLAYHGWDSVKDFFLDYKVNSLKTDDKSIIKYLAYVLSKSRIEDVPYDSDLNSPMMELMISRFSVEVYQLLIVK